MRSRRDRTDSSAVSGAGYRAPELAAGTQPAASTELAVAAHPGWAAAQATQPGGISAGPAWLDPANPGPAASGPAIRGRAVRGQAVAGRVAGRSRPADWPGRPSARR